jgi:hypothetical protein
MKIGGTSNIRSSAVAATLLCLVTVPGAPATTPQYQIYDIGVVEVGDTASQGFGVSRGGITWFGASDAQFNRRSIAL